MFVDTGGWFASVVPADVNHAVASRWLAESNEPLLTTDYVIDETLTLLRARGEGSRAAILGERLFNGLVAAVYYLSESDIRLTWHTFRRFSDKDWSFTDCSSKVVMEKLGVTRAFAFDHHFRQFGSITVVP